jgi:hypothetical protein
MTNNKIVKRLWIHVPEFGGFLVRHRNFLVFLFGHRGSYCEVGILQTRFYFATKPSRR